MSIPDIVLVTISLVIFSIYLNTLSLSIAGGDSGEIVAEGCELGIAHPPGYPLITILIHLIKIILDAITIKSIAYFVNITSALYTTIAIYYIGKSVDITISTFLPPLYDNIMSVSTISPLSSISKSETVSALNKNIIHRKSSNLNLFKSIFSIHISSSLVAMGMFAFSPLIWQYAVAAEVFPLNTMFASILIYMVLSFSTYPCLSTVYLGAFLCGLALCNQHTIILYEIPLILWILFLIRRYIYSYPLTLLYITLCFLIGLLPYIYLPLSNLYNPTGGSWGDVKSLHGFLHHILRRDYGTFQLYSGKNRIQQQDFIYRMNAYWKDILTVQGYYCIPILAIICVISMLLTPYNLYHGIIENKSDSNCDVSMSHDNSTSGTKEIQTDTMTKNATIISKDVMESTNNNNTNLPVDGKLKVKKGLKKTTKNIDQSNVINDTTDHSKTNIDKNISNGNYDSNSNDASHTSSKSPLTTTVSSFHSFISSYELSCTPILLILTQCFYFGIFHTLSNLPLSDKLLYGVHQRFWMQPNVVLFYWSGCGYYLIYVLIHYILYQLNTIHFRQNSSSSISLSSSSSSSISSPSFSSSVEQKDTNAYENSATTITTNTTKKSNISNTKTNTKDIHIHIDAIKSSICHTSSSSSPPSSSMIITMILSFLSTIIAFILVYLQYIKWYPISNQSDAIYFYNYAKAILSILPPKSVLLINYDQQWTSIRYLQRCENYRTDITTINLSMMSYTWFEHKRQLFSHLTFPGLYLASHDSIAVYKKIAFSLYDFLNTNTPKYKIFLGGKLSFPDSRIDKQYESIPYGFVNQFIPITKAPNGTYYQQMMTRNIKKIQRNLPELPPLEKYDESTWEWTIGRNYRDKLIEMGAYALESGINIANKDPIPLVYATYLLESLVYLEKNSSSIPPTSLLKNLGLAHVHLIQNKLLNPKSLPLLFKNTDNTTTTTTTTTTIESEDTNKGNKSDRDNNNSSVYEDILNTISYIQWPQLNTDWKTWCAEHFVIYWKEFLSRDDALLDPQYHTIKNIYETATTKGKNLYATDSNKKGNPGTSATKGNTGNQSPVKKSRISSKKKGNKKKRVKKKKELRWDRPH